MKNINKKKRLVTAVVVEDNMRISERIKWQIRTMFNQEIQVLSAKTFAEAKEILKLGVAEIWLVDFGLPDGNGEELIKLIRAQSTRIPIIAQTVITDLEYKVKIFENYERIKYLTKDTLFTQLTKAIFWARDEISYDLDYFISVPGKGYLESLSIHEIVYVMKLPGTQGLLLKLYDFEKKAYHDLEIKGMGLGQFLDENNKLGVFLRTHQSFVVNKKMIEIVYHMADQILMLYREEKDREIFVPIGPTYKRAVKAATKGLY